MALKTPLFVPLRPALPAIHPFHSIGASSTLGLARNRSNYKPKGRRTSSGTGTAVGAGATGTRHADAGSTEGPVVSSGGPSVSADAAPSYMASADERPSSELLGAAVRVYACLFDAVGDVIQASFFSMV